MNFPKLTFTAQIFKEGKQYSFNPELRAASRGKTPAKKEPAGCHSGVSFVGA